MTATKAKPAQQESEAVAKIEKFINSYVTLAETNVSLPLALWVMGTFTYTTFGAFPYVAITSDTKRSGKSRLSEIMAFISSNPRLFSAMTAATLFRSIEAEAPTLFMDEAEVLSGESASDLRAVLNVGYRQGNKIPRIIGGEVVEFASYCPKVFVLIGDVYDTLRDRSIIVRMVRAEAPQRFVYNNVKAEGEILREEIAEAIGDKQSEIAIRYEKFAGLEFLTDRDEEIWEPLFILCEIFCPSRVEELKRTAVDMSTEKTASVRRYVNLLGAEQEQEEKEYAERLVRDMVVIFGTNHVIDSATAIERLREIPTAPWRKFRGDGLTQHDLAAMLSRFGVKPKAVRMANNYVKGSKKFAKAAQSKEGKSAIRRGYKREDVQKASAAL